MKNNHTKYKVIKAYKSPYPDPILFHKGDKVALGKEFTDDPDWKGWIWCEGENKRQGWAPKHYLDIKDGKGAFKQDYNAMELSIAVGEKLIVHDIVNGFVFAEKANGTKGWAPLKNITGPT